jgi:hypothetical protein
VIFQGKIRNRIFDLLCAHPYGLTCKQLIDRVYVDDSEGGPEWGVTGMHVTISLMRKRLRKLYPLLHIENGKGYGRRYHLVIRKP